MKCRSPSESLEALIGLGSNLGGREENLRSALDKLHKLEGVSVTRVSSLYQTEPVGPVDQPEFLNAAAALKVSLPPVELLVAMHRIEAELGRTRKTHWGPRTIDLDMLMYGDLVLEEPHLRLPHPLLLERRFVLAPLADIAADVTHPVVGLTISDLLSGCRDTAQVELFEREWWYPTA